MGIILDFLAGLPTNANLRLQINALEVEVRDLREKLSISNREKLELESIVSVLKSDKENQQREIDEIKSIHQGNPLGDVEEKILMYLSIFTADSAPDDIAGSAGISAQKAIHLLEVMLKANLVTAQYWANRPPTWELASAGRAHLVKRGLL